MLPVLPVFPATTEADARAQPVMRIGLLGWGGARLNRRAAQRGGEAAAAVAARGVSRHRVGAVAEAKVPTVTPPPPPLASNSNIGRASQPTVPSPLSYTCDHHSESVTTCECSEELRHGLGPRVGGPHASLPTYRSVLSASCRAAVC